MKELREVANTWNSREKNLSSSHFLNQPVCARPAWHFGNNLITMSAMTNTVSACLMPNTPPTPTRLNCHKVAHPQRCTIARVLQCVPKQKAQLLLGDRATRKHAKDCWNGHGNDNLGWNDLQVYFKVIKNRTNRKLVYDFLLVVHSNFCRITRGLCETVQWPWKMPKVIDSRITWKLSCGHVCKMFGRQWPNEPKIAIVYDPILIWRPLSSEPPRISA